MDGPVWPPAMTRVLPPSSYLERVYGVGVVRVDTMNYNGKGKRGTSGPFERRDYKKAIVTLTSPFAFPEPPVVPEDGAAASDTTSTSSGGRSAAR